MSLPTVTKPLSLQEIDRLYLQGDRNLHQGNFTAAVDTFEQLLPVVDSNSRLYFDIQRGLVKAYQHNQQLEQAISLCQSIADSDVASKALWGQNFLSILSPDYQKPSDVQPDVTPQVSASSRSKPKTLSEFKQFCETNLLEHLKALEYKRKSTLRTIFVSATICLILTWGISFSLSYWIKSANFLLLYFYCLILPASAWVIFCRGCIYNYKIGFKRNIIESIVDFIGDHDRQLNYAAHLFLENKRQTIAALTRSQIFGDELKEPDYLEQEDCVYGTIGNTDIFFAEIIAETRKGSHLDEFGRENYRRKSVLFRGLFFEAKFVKNFVSRTFVMPNDLKGKISLLHNWRGDLIKLEDPEFARLFRVYGDSQIESRYILSANLMSRLVEFEKKAGRKVYLSFVDGFLYVAVPCRHNLFEPKLFKSMMSFTPLKEYFQDLELMIAIVDDLNLNRRIWG